MLNGKELNILFSQVFGYALTDRERRLGFFVDVPSTAEQDTKDWRERRGLAVQWARELASASHHLCVIYAYEAVGRANGDLIHPVYEVSLDDVIPACAADLGAYSRKPVCIDDVYARAEFWIALTQYSATAPLKIAASRMGFRAATMPGFTLSMLPALSVDLVAVDACVTALARQLTRAQSAKIQFETLGKVYSLKLDLRHRRGLASAGRMLCRGQAGNLPSGEAYIVPYEGELADAASGTVGILPLEKNGDILLCEVCENRIVCVDGDNPWAEKFRDWLEADPARCNIAELGLGVLGMWGIEAVGHVLLDEKLGLHIALGRSEHLGGVTSPADFLSSETVCHVDYVFHHKLMPHINVQSVALIDEDGKSCRIIENNRYLFGHSMP